MIDRTQEDINQDTEIGRIKASLISIMEAAKLDIEVRAQRMEAVANELSDLTRRIENLESVTKRSRK